MHIVRMIGKYQITADMRIPSLYSAQGAKDENIKMVIAADIELRHVVLLNLLFDGDTQPGEDVLGRISVTDEKASVCFHTYRILSS